MKLLKQLLGEGATFAKDIIDDVIDDSMEFIKGVTRACEPYARDVADQVAQVWEEMTKHASADEENASECRDSTDGSDVKSEETAREPEATNPELSLEQEEMASAFDTVMVSIDAQTIPGTDVKVSINTQEVSSEDSVKDYVWMTDGKRAHDDVRYAEWRRSSICLQLDKGCLDALTIHVDFCQAMDEPALDVYECRSYPASKKQKSLYWVLRRKCDAANIEYNKRDLPGSGAEYRAAISALERLLKDNGISLQ